MSVKLIDNELPVVFLLFYIFIFYSEPYILVFFKKIN